MPVLPPSFRNSSSRPPSRWTLPPWDESHPGYLEIDADLPSDHPARLIHRFVATLDLNPLQQDYANFGSPAFPVRWLLSFVLYEMYNKRTSPSQWARDATEARPCRWLLRGLRPSRAFLYTFRTRLGPYVHTWNQQLLKIAQEADLVDPQTVAIDGTTFASGASRHGPLRVTTLDKRHHRLQQELHHAFASGRRPTVSAASCRCLLVLALGLAYLTQPRVTPALRWWILRRVRFAGRANPPRWMAKTLAGKLRQMRRLRQCYQALGVKPPRLGRQEECPVRNRISWSDPQAVVAKDKEKVYRPLYNLQLSCSVSSDFILSWEVIRSASDSGQLMRQIGNTERASGQLVHRALVDSIFVTATEAKACEKRGTKIYSDLDEEQRRGVSEGMMSKALFRWSEEEQCYYCPAGNRLEYLRRGSEERAGGHRVEYTQYRCSPTHCERCELRGDCTKNPSRGRSLQRLDDEEYLEGVRQRSSTPEGEELYRQRKSTVERWNADVKEHRGFRQMSGMGLAVAEAEVGLVLLAINGVALVKADSGRRRLCQLTQVAA